ncbi:MAG: metal-sulfur cluster assembly factor [Actinomycetota bacterium]
MTTQPPCHAAPADVVDGLRAVIDPCCKEKGINVVDMGLIHSVDVADDGAARVTLVLTSGWCPFAVDLLGEVEAATRSVPGVTDATVELTWDVPWSTERLADSARAKLRWLPPPSAVPDRSAYLAENLTVVNREELFS